MKPLTNTSKQTQRKYFSIEQTRSRLTSHVKWWQKKSLNGLGANMPVVCPICPIRRIFRGQRIPQASLRATDVLWSMCFRIEDMFSLLFVRKTNEVSRRCFGDYLPSMWNANAISRAPIPYILHRKPLTTLFTKTAFLVSGRIKHWSACALGNLTWLSRRVKVFKMKWSLKSHRFLSRSSKKCCLLQTTKVRAPCL